MEKLYLLRKTKLDFVNVIKPRITSLFMILITYLILNFKIS